MEIFKKESNNNLIDILEVSIGELEELKSSKNSKYVVNKPFCIKFNLKGFEYSITIPSNFKSDGCTCGYDVGYAWLFHDYLYKMNTIDSYLTTKSIIRYKADKIMIDIIDYELSNTDNILNKFKLNINKYGLLIAMNIPFLSNILQNIWDKKETPKILTS